MQQEKLTDRPGALDRLNDVADGRYVCCVIESKLFCVLHTDSDH